MVTSIEDLKQIQREHGVTDTHLVYFHEDGDYGGYYMAHTDAERRTGMDLHDCRIHKWLEAFGDVESIKEVLEVETGKVYLIHAHQPDAVSESYRAEPWELELLP